MKRFVPRGHHPTTRRPFLCHHCHHQFSYSPSTANQQQQQQHISSYHLHHHYHHQHQFQYQKPRCSTTTTSTFRHFHQTSYTTTTQQQQQSSSSSTNNSNTNNTNNSNGKDPSIKSKIMQIYKKTHPDLFEVYDPIVKLTNQQSLQKLNNFLDEYKGYEVANNASKHLHSVNGLNIGTNKYHLQFYIKREKRERQKTMDETEKQLKKLEMRDMKVGNEQELNENDENATSPEQLIERDLHLIKITVSGPPGECGIVEKSKQMSKNLSRLFRVLKIYAPGEKPSENVDDGDDRNYDDILADMMESDDTLDDKARELLAQTFAYMGKDQQFKAGTHCEYGAHNIAAFVLKQLHLNSKQNHAHHKSGNSGSSSNGSSDGNGNSEGVNGENVSPDVQYFLSRQAEVEAHLLRNKIVEFLCLDDLRFEPHSFNVQAKLETLHKLKSWLHDEYGIATENWGYKELTIEAMRQKESDDYSKRMNYQDPVQQANARIFREKREELSVLCSQLDRMRDNQRTPGFVRAMFIRGNRSFVSNMGYVMLGSDLSAEQWLQYLMRECNYAQLEKYVIRKYKVLDSEKQVIRTLGIKSIVSENDDVFIDVQYEELLHGICERVKNDTSEEQYWQRQQHYLQHLRIVITEVDDTPGSVNEPSIHPVFGFLTCPICSVDELFQTMEKYGPEASAKCQDYMHNRDTVIRLIHETKKYLKLEHLEYVRTLDSQAVIACCHKMIRSAAILKPILNNLSVCISDGYHWREHDNVLEIPVDF